MIIAAALIAVGAMHFALSRLRVAWLGALVPSLYVIAVAVLFQRGLMDTPLDYFMAAFGMFALLSMWADGRKAAARKLTPAT